MGYTRVIPGLMGFMEGTWILRFGIWSVGFVGVYAYSLGLPSLGFWGLGFWRLKVCIPGVKSTTQ